MYVGSVVMKMLFADSPNPRGRAAEGSTSKKSFYWTIASPLMRVAGVAVYTYICTANIYGH